MFTLTDPAIESIANIENECQYLFEQSYSEFTRKRIEYDIKMKDDHEHRFVFDEDLMYLTKEYYVQIIQLIFIQEVYQDNLDTLKMKGIIGQHI